MTYCVHLKKGRTRAMLKRIHQSIIGAYLLLAGLAQTPALAAASLEKVNASYGAISGSMAQTWVAKEARLYEKYGLDLNLVYISGGPRAIMALIGGSVQFVNHSGMPALEAYQRGADTALIASPMNQLEHSLVVQKNITSVEQLRGKLLGMSTAGSLTDILLREGLPATPPPRRARSAPRRSPRRRTSSATRPRRARP